MCTCVFVCVCVFIMFWQYFDFCVCLIVYIQDCTSLCSDNNDLYNLSDVFSCSMIVFSFNINFVACAVCLFLFP